MRNDSATDLVVSVLNTTPTVDGTRRDLLAGDEGVAFVQQWGGTGEACRDALAVARNVVQEIVTTGVVASDVSTALTRQTVQRPKLGADGLSWELETPPDSALAMRFLIEWTELVAEHPGRLKRCANSECSLFLLDRSNANARRWCSMAGCGNRLKARRHHRRTAGQR